MEPVTEETKSSKPKLWLSRRRLILLIALLAFALLVLLDLRPYFEYRNKKNQIRDLIVIGSNIDDAGPILKANGFSYYDKHFATVAEDRYWIDVTVAHKPRPWTLTALQVFGVRVYFHWVVIEAGLDNRVREIF